AAWGNTARTQEASVLLEGGGLVDLPAANDPLLFATPATLSLGTMDARRAPQRRQVRVSVSDAGGGAGSWVVGVRSQSSSTGVTLLTTPEVIVPDRGEVSFVLTVRV